MKNTLSILVFTLGVALANQATADILQPEPAAACKFVDGDFKCVEVGLWKNKKNLTVTDCFGYLGDRNDEFLSVFRKPVVFDLKSLRGHYE